MKKIVIVAALAGMTWMTVTPAEALFVGVGPRGGVRVGVGGFGYRGGYRGYGYRGGYGYRRGYGYGYRRPGGFAVRVR